MALCVAGCATTPAAKIDALAAQSGAVREQVTGFGFEHVVYTKGVVNGSSKLNIYFEGDGVPWLHRQVVSKDPTPREPLALKLMLADPAPSMYISRPCYQALGPTPPCDPALWTFARYSEPVVASMQAVVSKLLDRAPAAAVTLVGYSGGGVLAMFVAEREARIGTLVTVATNLDTDAWTSQHGYSPLDSSLNPALVTHWRSSLRQIHYAGAADSNVPPAIARAFAMRVPQAELHVVPAYNHRCCWVQGWPAIMQQLGVEPAQPPGDAPLPIGGQ